MSKPRAVAREASALLMRIQGMKNWTRDGMLIVATFPHHGPVSRDEDVTVMPSKGAELALVLEEIALSIDTSGHSSR
ncbi:hypothetical protein [Thiocystis violacea]|uniref:hypothetical protein n=1 Tax=Thiocystis violacea TaxID=13725 RepID=UPI001906BF5B|nr:hypothetical protein [Thiocystis violacea]